jgi:hypothetical protein
MFSEGHGHHKPGMHAFSGQEHAIEFVNHALITGCLPLPATFGKLYWRERLDRAFARQRCH